MKKRTHLKDIQEDEKFRFLGKVFTKGTSYDVDGDTLVSCTNDEGGEIIHLSSVCEVGVMIPEGAICKFWNKEEDPNFFIVARYAGCYDRTHIASVSNRTGSEQYYDSVQPLTVDQIQFLLSV